MCECLICNKVFKAIDPLGPHLKLKHNMTMKEYYDKFLKKPNEGICPICGKETNFLKITKGYQKHCSCKCAAKDDETIKTRENTVFNKTGCINVSQTKENKAKVTAAWENMVEEKYKKFLTDIKNYGILNY